MTCNNSTYKTKNFSRYNEHFVYDASIKKFFIYKKMLPTTTTDIIPIWQPPFKLVNLRNFFTTRKINLIIFFQINLDIFISIHFELKKKCFVYRFFLLRKSEIFIINNKRVLR